ncbi:Uronyl 2-sulfotransferase [Collichthys lucidus]|uniref:Uronyl 2-sulfotransferase n=1 Tax=Collichthys lucidus TaxID=240159 RepID=A0A4U5UMZ0_COLLU|nr:Uronyl 2-sulfotransferase [Collichthys lucidus]
MMKNFSSSPLHSNNQTPNHIRERNNRKYSLLSAIPFRFSLRGYGFCMATLFFFCFGSLFYQLNGGPPKILLDIRQYLAGALQPPGAHTRNWHPWNKAQ